MHCEISTGELLDKISILRIKNVKIQDEAKLKHVRKELLVLEALARVNKECESFIQRLTEVNLALWDTEDAIRRMEAVKQFDEEFIRLARSIYRTNDKRFEIKNEADCHFSSELQEQKSYDKY